MFEIREIKNKEEYNPLLINKNAPFTQAWFYGEWQEMIGRPAQGWSASSRKVRRFEVKEGSDIIGFFQIIKYPLPLSNSLLYIPHGPLLRQGFGEQAGFLKEFKKRLLEIAKEENAIFIRFDLYFHNSNYESKENFNKYFHKVSSYAYHSVYFQPKYEWILDIDKPESELLGNMHPKNRYNIRLAGNKGVAIEIVENNFEKCFEDFYSLMEKTGKRNNFKLHPKIYYRNIFDNCEENKNVFLVLAKYNDKVLAMNLILLFGETAYFIFGGSSDEFKNLMAPHLLHWQGIIKAKNRGCKFYNFGGVGSGDDYKYFGGISRFKKRFGGRLIEYSDSYDLVLKPLWYWLYNLRKKLQLY